MKTLSLSDNYASQGIKRSIEECYDIGLSSEAFVKKLIMDKCGGVVYDATVAEDKYKHIDLWWDSPKKGRLGIDVKGLRKKKRKDNVYDDSIQWIEIVNVCGYPGWIYGKMDYVAFVTKHDVIFVKPYKLISLIQEKTNQTFLAIINPNSDYVLYQRQGRSDIIVRVPTDDIRPLAHFTLEFGEESNKLISREN